MRISDIITQKDLDEDFSKFQKAAAGAAMMGSLMYAGSHRETPAQASATVELPQATPYVSPLHNVTTPKTARTKMTDEHILALTIWGEARNHGVDGMRAIAHVIMNRLVANRPSLGGDTLKGVVTKRKQFSCWNPNDPNHAAMLDIDNLDEGSPDYEAWQEAKKIAHDVLSGKDRDPTNKALYYHTTGVHPAWATGIKAIGQYANHLFYRKVAKA
jgi:spore germination cell wall hydrolase CwlJ-like protein